MYVLPLLSLILLLLLLLLALHIPTEDTAIPVLRYNTIVRSTWFWCGDGGSDVFLDDDRFSKRYDERITVFTIESTLYM